MLKERFESHVHLIPFTDCHIWDKDATGGYGKIRVDGRTLSAHRVSYELYVGKIPKGKCIMHKCDNRACVNPDHLMIGTQKDNMDDMRIKGRGARGERCNKAKLTEADIVRIKDIYPRLTQVKIAKMFNVSQASISYIVKGINWKHTNSL